MEGAVEPWNVIAIKVAQLLKDLYNATTNTNDAVVDCRLRCGLAAPAPGLGGVAPIGGAS